MGCCPRGQRQAAAIVLRAACSGIANTRLHTLVRLSGCVCAWRHRKGCSLDASHAVLSALGISPFCCVKTVLSCSVLSRSALFFPVLFCSFLFCSFLFCPFLFCPFLHSTFSPVPIPLFPVTTVRLEEAAEGPQKHQEHLEHPADRKAPLYTDGPKSEKQQWIGLVHLPPTRRPGQPRDSLRQLLHRQQVRGVRCEAPRHSRRSLLPGLSRLDARTHPGMRR